MSLRADIDRGLEIREEMEKLAAELKEIDTRVKHAALHGEQVDLADPEREGRQFLAAGSKLVVPVVLTADKLIGSFKPSSPAHVKILNALIEQSHHLGKFFDREIKFVNRFDSGKKFRSEAVAVLGPKAPAFITSCVATDRDGIAKSDIKIMWDDAAAKTN